MLVLKKSFKKRVQLFKILCVLVGVAFFTEIVGLVISQIYSKNFEKTYASLNSFNEIQNHISKIKDATINIYKEFELGNIEKFNELDVRLQSQLNLTRKFFLKNGNKFQDIENNYLNFETATNNIRIYREKFQNLQNLKQFDKAINSLMILNSSFYSSIYEIEMMRSIIEENKKVAEKKFYSANNFFLKINILVNFIIIMSFLIAFYFAIKLKNQIKILDEQNEYNVKRLLTLEESLEKNAIISRTNSLGKIIYANKNFEEVSGYSQEELLGKDHRILNSNTHTKKFFEEMWQTLLKGNSWRGQICNKAKNGKLYWVDSTLTPILELNGQIKEILSIRYDITKQMIQKFELEKQREQLNSMITNSPGMVYQFFMNGVTKDCFFSFVSSQAYSIYEITENDFIKDPSIMVKMVYSEDQYNLAEAINKSAVQLSPFEWIGRIQTGKKNIKWIRAKSMPKLLPTNDIIWDGIIIDISEEKNLQISLDHEKAKSLQSAKLASLGEMSAAIAHEINNPLAIISGTAEVILNNLEDKNKIIKKIENINKAVGRISKIINGLKKFSRSTEVKTYINISLAEIVREALILTEAKAKRLGVEIKCFIESEEMIFCDEVDIEQVLVNLIHNAIDALEKSNEKWVHLKVFKEKDELVLLVIDAGNGIPDQFHEKVFEPFYTTKVVGKGTGLGLSIVKGIIDEHKALISINKNNPNTCFEIRFKAVEVVNVA